MSRRQRRARAVELLAYGLPKAEVARRIGAHRHSISDWLTSGEFAAQVEERSAELREEFRARLHELGLKAIDALKAALAGEGTTAQVKAAQMVLAAIGALEPKTAVDTHEKVEVSFPVPDWLLSEGSGE